MICDWCSINIAEFVAVTGALSDMEIREWVLCVKHANILRNKRDDYSLQITEKILVDVWDLHPLTLTVKRYYKWET